VGAGNKRRQRMAVEPPPVRAGGGASDRNRRVEPSQGRDHARKQDLHPAAGELLDDPHGRRGAREDHLEAAVRPLTDVRAEGIAASRKFKQGLQGARRTATAAGRAAPGLWGECPGPAAEHRAGPENVGGIGRVRGRANRAGPRREARAAAAPGAGWAGRGRGTVLAGRGVPYALGSPPGLPQAAEGALPVGGREGAEDGPAPEVGPDAAPAACGSALHRGRARRRLTGPCPPRSANRTAADRRRAVGPDRGGEPAEGGRRAHGSAAGDVLGQRPRPPGAGIPGGTGENGLGRHRIQPPGPEEKGASEAGCPALRHTPAGEALRSPGRATRPPARTVRRYAERQRHSALTLHGPLNSRRCEVQEQTAGTRRKPAPSGRRGHKAFPPGQQERAASRRDRVVPLPWKHRNVIPPHRGPQHSDWKHAGGGGDRDAVPAQRRRRLPRQPVPSRPARGRRILPGLTTATNGTVRNDGPAACAVSAGRPHLLHVHGQRHATETRPTNTEKEKGQREALYPLKGTGARDVEINVTHTTAFRQGSAAGLRRFPGTGAGAGGGRQDAAPSLRCRGLARKGEDSPCTAA
jgi:hypothetical protein